MINFFAHDQRAPINYVYNPRCVYNAEWSCPLPPGEKWLKVPIRAGEKSLPGANTTHWPRVGAVAGP